MPDPRHKQNDDSKQAGPVFAWWPESSEHSGEREFLWNAALLEQMRGEHPEIWWPAGRGPWTIEETREELLRRQQQGQALKRSMMVATTVAAVASGTVLSPGLGSAAAAPAPAAAPNAQNQATLGSASAASNQGAITAAPEGGTTYTINKGDTMRGIAAQFGISTKALIAANSVGNPDLIHPGDKLNIPSGDAAAAVEGGPEIEVKAGDTIAKLAEQYGVSPNAIVRYAANKITNPDLIIVGQKLTIPGGREAVVESAPPAGGGQSEAASVETGPEIVVKAGDTIAKLAARYGVKQSAIVGHAANKINDSNLIVVGQKLTIPGGQEPAEEPAPQETPKVAAVQQQPAVQETVKAVAEPEKPAPAPEPAPAPVVQASGDFAWPTKGAITQKFGPSSLSMEPAYNGYAHFHQGLDIAAGMNTAIVAADGGSVVQSGWNGGYGYSVTIDHGNGLVTLYGHMASQPPVGVGQKVGQGQRIGSMGSTGASTGPHLHFAVKKNGTWVDPLKYLP